MQGNVKLWIHDLAVDPDFLGVVPNRVAEFRMISENQETAIVAVVGVEDCEIDALHITCLCGASE
jgi:hypothetical protein